MLELFFKRDKNSVGAFPYLQKREIIHFQFSLIFLFKVYSRSYSWFFFGRKNFTVALIEMAFFKESKILNSYPELF